MRLGTLGGRLALIADDRALDVHAASNGRLPREPLEGLAQWRAVRDWATAARWDRSIPVSPTQLSPPVPAPRQVFAVALNYRPHAAEAGFVAPADPLIFTKFPSCITGPAAEVRLPPEHVDWEAELVAVVGTGGHRIPVAEAWAALAGLTAGQDLSERISQLAGQPAQFSLGKSFPGFGPTGPVVVTTDELDDPDDLLLTATLNGAGVQSARTSEMIFPVADLVARISHICPLLPGDLIFTGTPAGVGNRREPPVYLGPGDQLVTEVEGIGQISQKFISLEETVDRVSHLCLK